MTSKSWRLWMSTRDWCFANPGKRAAIVTPDGMFEITFNHKPLPMPEPIVKFYDELAVAPSLDDHIRRLLDR